MLMCPMCIVTLLIMVISVTYKGQESRNKGNTLLSSGIQW